MATKKPRVKVTLDDETLAAIDDFMRRNNYPDKSMAMHELIKIALEATKDDVDPTPKIHRRSKTGGDPE